MISKDNKAFTLIELLVVISIISFLSSIVLASLNTAREKGRIAAGQEFAASINHATGDELSGQWNFDGNQNDSSGLNNNASGGSPIYVTGVNGLAARYNHTATNLTNNTLLDSPSFTLSFWIEPNSIQNLGYTNYGANNGIMTREVYNTSGFRFGFTEKGYVHFWTGESGGTFGVGSSKPISAGKFYHIVVTYSNGSGAMYIDGQLVGSGTGTYIVPTGRTLSLNVAANYTPGDNTYDDVRYYTKSLTATEIKYIYAQSTEKYLASNKI